MDDDDGDYYRHKRARAIEALDHLIELEKTITQTKDENERARIAWSSGPYFMELSGYFSTIEMAFNQVFPVIEDEDDEFYFGMAYPVWRSKIAAYLREGIPIPLHDRRTLQRALLALNEGEVMYAVEPTPTGKRKRAWTITTFKMLAIIHTYVLRGNGYKAKAARTIVAEAFGYGAAGGDETIRTWEVRDLKKAFKEHSIKRWKSIAERLGKRGLHFDKIQNVDEDAIHELLEIEGMEMMIEYHAAMSLRACTLDVAGENYKKALAGEQVEIPSFIG